MARAASLSIAKTEAVGDPLLVHGAQRAHAEQAVDAAVDAGLVAVLVEVEAAGILAPESSVGTHHRDDPRRAEALAECLVHRLGGLLADVEADLVHQRDRADRKAPVRHRLVNALDRGPFLEQEPRLVEVRQQDPVDPESR